MRMTPWGRTEARDCLFWGGPTTVCLATRPHEYGSPTRARTWDLRINSPSLYQLSYRGTSRLFYFFRNVRVNLRATPRFAPDSHVGHVHVRRGELQVVEHRPQRQNRCDPQRERAEI